MHFVPVEREVFLFIEVWSQRAVDCCLLLGRLSHEVIPSDIVEMEGDGKKKEEEKSSKTLAYFFASLSK